MRAHTDFHFTLYDASQSPWLVALIRPAWDRSERFRPALLASRPASRRTATRSSTRRCSPPAWRTTRSGGRGALHDHLELASLFFKTELGGQGIFE